MEPAANARGPVAVVSTIDQTFEMCRNLAKDFDEYRVDLIRKEVHQLQEMQQQAGRQSPQAIQQLTFVQNMVAVRQEELRRIRRNLMETINTAFELMQGQDTTGRRLSTWKRNQKTEQIGEPFPERGSEFNAIYSEFDALPAYVNELEMLVRWVIDKINEYPIDPVEASQLVDHLSSIHFQLTSRGQEFSQQYLLPVVSKQPEPVLKTKTKINPLEVSILGAVKTNIQQELQGIQFTVDIITQEAARQIAAGKLHLSNVKLVGNIINPTQKLTMNERGQVTVLFNDAKLDSVERRTKTSSNGAAIEQKYVLLFHSGPLQDGTILYALSLPVMVTVHGSQSCELGSAIFWLRAFGSVDYNETENEAATAVPWPTLARDIIRLFAITTQAKMPLSDAAVNYLAEKMFGPASSHDPMRAQTFVTLERFAKSSMNDKVEFSCWSYLYSIMQLIKQKEVLEFWNNGWLLGFVSKEEADAKIKSLDYPTFLIRFCDSVEGALSIVCLSEVPQGFNHSQGQRIDNGPFTAGDLSRMSLRQIIQALKCLTNIHHLYPDVKKVRVTDKVVEQPQMAGYVRGNLVIESSTFHSISVPSPPVHHHPNKRCRSESHTDQSGGGGGYPASIPTACTSFWPTQFSILPGEQPCSNRIINMNQQIPYATVIKVSNELQSTAHPHNVSSPLPDLTPEELDEYLIPVGC